MHYFEFIAIITIITFCIRTLSRRKYHANMPDTRMPHCLYAWQHREQMFAVGHFPILTNSLTLHIFCNIDLYTHINISSMNASSFVYIDVVIICTMMSFYQQILHSFSCYNVLCIGNLTYAGHFAVCPSRTRWQYKRIVICAKSAHYYYCCCCCLYNS